MENKSLEFLKGLFSLHTKELETLFEIGEKCNETPHEVGLTIGSIWESKKETFNSTLDLIGAYHKSILASADSEIQDHAHTSIISDLKCSFDNRYDAFSFISKLGVANARELLCKALAQKGITSIDVFTMSTRYILGLMGVSDELIEENKPSRKTYTIKVSVDTNLVSFDDLENAIQQLDIDDMDLLEEYDD